MGHPDDPQNYELAAEIRELREATIAAVEALAEAARLASSPFGGGAFESLFLAPEQRPEAKIKAALDRLRALDPSQDSRP